MVLCRRDGLLRMVVVFILRLLVVRGVGPRTLWRVLVVNVGRRRVDLLRSCLDVRIRARFLRVC